MWSLFKKESDEALSQVEAPVISKSVTCITGVAAYPLIKQTIDNAMLKWHNLECNVYAIENNFFGEKITVAGLVTGGDIINQLKGKKLGDTLFVPACMLRFERDLFLDDVSVEELGRELGVEVKVIETDGYSFIEALAECEY
jgi:NifB/MoaA-like Fe-S oxidoreductase